MHALPRLFLCHVATANPSDLQLLYLAIRTTIPHLRGGGGLYALCSVPQPGSGSRIWVNVPGRGYVEVGIVTGTSTPITEFMLTNKFGQSKSIKEIVPSTPSMDVPLEEQEHYVKVNWLKTVSLVQAIKEKGFFGNQNSVAKPKAKKWIHTIDRLIKRFEITT